MPTTHATPRLLAIDRLRAVAVLGVIFTHALIIAIPFRGPLRELAEPIHWVGLFFAVSGALVAKSLLALPRGRSRMSSVAVMLVRRWLRLALPHAAAFVVYSLPIVVALIAQINWTIDVPRNLLETLLTLGLFSAWSPMSLSGQSWAEVSTVVIGNWSISAEWFAALVIIPCATILISSPRYIALAAVFFAIVFTFVRAPVFQWAPYHAPAFLVGVWAARSAADSRGEQIDSRMMFIAFAVLFLVGISTKGIAIFPAVELIWGVIVLRALRDDRLAIGVMDRGLVWLGSRSYGAYLFHMIGLAAMYGWMSDTLSGVALWAATSAGALAFAIIGGELTSRLLERPAIAIGRTLAERLSK